MNQQKKKEKKKSAIPAEIRHKSPKKVHWDYTEQHFLELFQRCARQLVLSGAETQIKWAAGLSSAPWTAPRLLAASHNCTTLGKDVRARHGWARVERKLICFCFFVCLLSVNWLWLVVASQWNFLEASPSLFLWMSSKPPLALMYTSCNLQSLHSVRKKKNPSRNIIIIK